MRQRVNGTGKLRWPAGRAIGRKKSHGRWRGLVVLTVQGFHKGPNVLRSPNGSARA